MFREYFAQSKIIDKLQLNPRHPPELNIKIAAHTDEIEQALRIVYRSYLEKGYCLPNSNHIRLTEYHLRPETLVVLLLWENKIVGTASIFSPNLETLPLEKIFDIEHLKKDNRRIAEIGSLAISREFRKVHGELFFPLLGYLWNLCRDQLGYEKLVIAVNPDNELFYKTLLAFKNISTKKIKSYNYVAGAPAVGLYTDLWNFDVLLKKIYKNRPRHQNLYQFICCQKNTYTPLGNSNLKQITLSLPLYHWVKQGRQFRFKNPFPLITQQNQQVLDFSKGGIKLKLPPDQKIISKKQITVPLNADHWTTLLIDPVWVKKDGTSGFEILKSSNDWQQLF